METAVVTGPPRVTLRNSFSRPYDGAIAAARTCYSPRVVGPDEVTDKQRETIGPLTFEGGHHTVYQHAHFEFGLENVSRQFVWSFLHSHSFYNSEQSSQRFVRLDEVRAHVPPDLAPEARRVYEDAVAAAWEAYRRLAGLLKEDTRRILGEVRHLTARASEKRRKKVEREAEKKAIEVARYVIPVAAFTSMVHTVSGIVLHRLYRMMRTGDVPRESAAVVLPEAALAHRRQPGPAPPDGAGIAAADDADGHAPSGLRDAAFDPGQPGGARGLQRGDGASVDGQEPAAGDGRTGGVGRVPAPEREGAPLP